MIDMAISVNGEKAVLLSFHEFENFENEMDVIMGEWAIEVLDGDLYGTQNYAPPPAGSKYIRTGNLGTNWGVMRPHKLAVAFQNNVGYGGYVVGDGEGEWQAGVHMGRWWLARRKVDARLDALADRIERRADVT